MLGSLMMLASGLERQFAQPGQSSAIFWSAVQVLREVGDDAAGERDVPGLDRDAGVAW